MLTPGRATLLIVIGLLLTGTTAPAGMAAPDTAPAPPSLPILVYHQIRPSGASPADSYTAISRTRFEWQMQYLRDEGYRTLTMEEVLGFLRGEPFPPKVVAVQIDDGWKSDLEAAAVLTRYDLRASFWVIPGTGIGAPHLEWADLHWIAANPRFEIYAHSMTHPTAAGDAMTDWLIGPSPGHGFERARREIIEPRRLLEEKLGRPVPFFAWPGGFYNQTLVGIARDAGYRALLTVDDGLNLPGGDPFRIRRTMIHGGCDEDTFKRVLASGHHTPCQ